LVITWDALSLWLAVSRASLKAHKAVTTIMPVIAGSRALVLRLISMSSSA